MTIRLALALCLVAVAARAEVSRFHPRVYVRHDAARVGRGITVKQLQARLKDPAYSRWRAPDPGRGAAAAMERAARYLETGDGADLAAVRDFLATHTYSYEKNDVGGFLAGAEMAAAFDWIYHGLSDAQRAAALANVLTTAESSHRFLRRGGPDINHNYTYMALNTIAVCGLVMHGEAEPYGSKAAEYLALARQMMEGPGRVIDTWRARQGAWGEGSHYTFHETLRTLVLMLQAYRTASDTDYFGRLDMSGAGRYLVACTRPDMTFERTGDTSANRVQAALTVPLTVEMLAAGLRDAAEAARLRSFSRALLEAYGERAVHPAFGWGMRMFFDPRARLTPSYQTLPLAMRLGAGTDEHIMLRNGWREGSTLITILAGDHYTDHQHFDKGQFLIYHRGGLTVDSGAYDGMYKPNQHPNEYGQRTLAHNCVLVYDPGERLPKGYTNDGGQRVLRGLQHHDDWREYLAHRDREHLNTAAVLACDLDPANRYHYVRADLKGAYGGKVTRYDRQFVYLPAQDYLVILDRVNAASAEFRKRWLLHFQEQPEIDGTLPEPGVREFVGARLVTARRRGEFDAGGRRFTYDGVLFVHALLPAERSVVSVGGPGYEFYNAFSGVNYPVSRAAVAAETREAGNWRIETAPSRPSLEDRFLHALEMRSGASAKPTETRRVSAAGVTGVHFRAPRENQVVVFAETGDLPLVYEVTATAPSAQFVARLAPGQGVAVEVNGRRLRPVRVSPQGVLSFRDTGAGARRIVVRGPGKS